MKQKTVKLLAALVLCATLLTGALDVTLSAAHLATVTEASAEADVLVWYYKIENGHLYERLWNGTKEYWVTDWILCP